MILGGASDEGNVNCSRNLFQQICQSCITYILFPFSVSLFPFILVPMEHWSAINVGQSSCYISVVIFLEE